MFNFFRSKKKDEIDFSLINKAYTPVEEVNTDFDVIKSYWDKSFKLISSIEAQSFLQKAIPDIDIEKQNINEFYEKRKNTIPVDEMIDSIAIGVVRAILDVECLTPMIDQYVQVLSRKKKMLITYDDYGDLDVDKWHDEFYSFYDRKALPKLIDWWRESIPLTNYKHLFLKLSPNTYSVNDGDFISIAINRCYKDYIINRILKEVDSYNKNDVSNYDSSMNGHEYEYFVADKFIEQGWDAQVTKGSGDHGVDIIVSYPPIKLAIQCKHYNSSVGNKAIQEVYSAKDIFDCDFAVVVSNNTYTPAAQEAANKLSVALLHHEDIPEYCSWVEEQLTD